MKPALVSDLYCRASRRPHDLPLGAVVLYGRKNLHNNQLDFRSVGGQSLIEKEKSDMDPESDRFENRLSTKESFGFRVFFSPFGPAVYRTSFLY